MACLGAVHVPSSAMQATGTAITLAPVVVTGVLPGPALWRVSKGDHVMWVLGLTSPVPRRMQWKSAEVERRIASSQAVLKLPSLAIGVRTSFYRSSMMTPPQELGTNPNHQTLRDVVSPATYRHWLQQKARYLGDKPRVERLRPILAGRELYEAALKHYGLVDEYGLERIVYQTAERDRVAAVQTSYQLLLKDPRDAVRALNDASLNDQACLDQVLAALDHDLAQATARANAWATGDIDTLRSIYAQAQEDSCLSTLDESQFARTLGIDDIGNRVKQHWIDIAQRALDDDRQTFAVLPMHELLAPDGYLAALRSHGYRVEAPAD